jgi:hypothetical protein
MDQNSIFTETANLGYPNCQLSTCIYNPFWGTQIFSHTNLKPPAWHENHVFCLGYSEGRHFFGET